MSNHATLKQAVTLAQAGDWQASHLIAQDYTDAVANWLHAVLHKIEGDAWNSQYWYAKTGGHHYEDYGSDTMAELAAIADWLDAAD